MRERKDNDKLLALVSRRLEVTDDPAEIQKLFWEQARVLRERGDQDGALKALEHVTMLDPDHVGALALLGEINIRRGNFEEAAASLGAPRASRGGAREEPRHGGHRRGRPLREQARNASTWRSRSCSRCTEPSSRPCRVRERLARAAARTGSWKEATDILEELMHERPEAEGRIEAARLAMAIHRDRLGQSRRAAPPPS